MKITAQMAHKTPSPENTKEPFNIYHLNLNLNCEATSKWSTSLSIFLECIEKYDTRSSLRATYLWRFFARAKDKVFSNLKLVESSVWLSWELYFHNEIFTSRSKHLLAELECLIPLKLLHQFHRSKSWEKWLNNGCLKDKDRKLTNCVLRWWKKTMKKYNQTKRRSRICLLYACWLIQKKIIIILILTIIINVHYMHNDLGVFRKSWMTKLTFFIAMAGRFDQKFVPNIAFVRTIIFTALNVQYQAE